MLDLAKENNDNRSDPAEQASGMRLNKYLSRAGYCSRRRADELIERGQVLVNGRPAGLGQAVYPGDRVEAEGHLLTAPSEVRATYLMLNKPAGIVTTAAPDVKENVIDFVAYPERVYPVGRLDKDSRGLLLLTNDGDFSYHLMRAGDHSEKEYHVLTDRPVTASFLEQMAAGVYILGQRTAPCRVKKLGDCRFSIILIQGLNRQIRRMTEACGLRVKDLQRVRINGLHLGRLEEGAWRHLSRREVEALKQAYLQPAKGGR